MPDFEFERLHFYALKASDLHSIHELHSFPEVAQYNTIGIPKNLAATRRVLSARLDSSDRKPGLAHLGLQAENGTVLKQLYQQMKQAEGDIKEEGDTVCCYAKSEKSWIEDPEGISWEVFHTYGEATFYGSGENAKKAPESMDNWQDHQKANSCCGPQ